MNFYSPEVFISEEDIAIRVQTLGNAITKDFANEELVVICVLKGAFVFCSDLIKKINLPLRIEFLSASSYGDGTVSSGVLKMQMDVSCSLEGRNVLLVEDIVDTGLTISEIVKHIENHNPKSVRVASLLYKPEKLKHSVTIDYLAFEIEDRFVVGYGLDYAGRFRELPYLGVLNAGH